MLSYPVRLLFWLAGLGAPFGRHQSSKSQRGEIAQALGLLPRCQVPVQRYYAPRRWLQEFRPNTLSGLARTCFHVSKDQSNNVTLDIVHWDIVLWALSTSGTTRLRHFPSLAPSDLDTVSDEIWIRSKYDTLRIGIGKVFRHTLMTMTLLDQVSFWSPQGAMQLVGACVCVLAKCLCLLRSSCFVLMFDKGFSLRSRSCISWRNRCNVLTNERSLTGNELLLYGQMTHNQTFSQGGPYFKRCATLLLTPQVIRSRVDGSPGVDIDKQRKPATHRTATLYDSVNPFAKVHISLKSHLWCSIAATISKILPIRRQTALCISDVSISPHALV